VQKKDLTNRVPIATVCVSIGLANLFSRSPDMLENVDLTAELSPSAYRKKMGQLQDRLRAMQKATWQARIPVIVLFEGWNAAGKGSAIRKLTSCLDPRGYKFHPVRSPRTYEKQYPWLWRFWLKIPGRGEWALFSHSWYERVLVERLEGAVPKKEWQRAYNDIAHFEHLLTDDGYLIVKFWLHISKKEQKKRFDKLLKDPLTAWQVSDEDWGHHQNYRAYHQAVEDMLSRTHTPWTPWTLVPAMDQRYVRVQVFETLVNTIDKELGAKGISLAPEEEEAPPAPVAKPARKARPRRPAARRGPSRARA
jgi:polyphosphate kinase 2 (PPK2 family)